MGDPIRRSGEFRIEQNLGELVSSLAERIEGRVESLSADFKEHSKSVEKRLAEGDTKMALMNQSIEGVNSQLTTIRSDIKAQSDKIRDIEAKRPVDHTPKATPALEPKPEKPPQSRIEKLAWKGLEAGVMAVCAAFCLGVFLWFVRGNAAKIIDTSPAAAPTATPSPIPTTPP